MSKASKYLKLKNFREKQFESHLSNLKPVGRVDLQGLSLVAKFSPNFPELILTCDESGYGYLINSLELEMKKEKGLIAPFNLLPKKEYKCDDNGAIFDIEWHDESRKFLIASGQSNSLLFDAETGEKIFENPLNNCHIRTIKSCLYNNNLFVSGGRDGRLILWDCRIGKFGSLQITDFEINDMKQTSDSYTGITFYTDEKTLITSQANNENVKFWDLRKVSLDKPKLANNKTKVKKSYGNTNLTINQFTYLEKRIKRINDDAESIKKNISNIDYSYFKFFQKEFTDFLNNIDNVSYISKVQNSVKGISSIFLNKKQNQLMANSIENSILVYDLNILDCQKPKEFKGHKTNYYVKSAMSPCSKYILSGSIDHNLYIWRNTEEINKPIIILKNAHNGEINGVDWGINNSNFIATTGDDRTLLIWDFI